MRFSLGLPVCFSFFSFGMEDRSVRHGFGPEMEFWKKKKKLKKKKSTKKADPKKKVQKKTSKNSSKN